MSTRRYPSDLTDAQWELIRRLLPEPNTGGRPEKHPRREVVNAILYVVRSGCPWRYLPKDLPPWQTVYWYFQQWEQSGVITTLLSELRIKAHRRTCCEDQPSAGIANPQSVDAVDTANRDAAKRIKVRNRLITRVTRPLVSVAVMMASWQERDDISQAWLWAF